MGNSRGGLRAIVASLCVALVGCNAVPEQGVSKRSEALTPGPSFTLQLPPQITAGGSGLTVSTTLTLGDRVKVKQPTGSAFAGVVNLGAGQTFLGRDSNFGDVWSVGSVHLGDRSVVSGFLKTAGTFDPGVNTTITGLLQQNQPLTPPTLATVTVQFQNGASPFPVANDTTRSLSPGDYAAVSIASRGTLALSTGDYRFDSLATQLPSTLRLTTTGGPIRVFIRNTLSWNSIVTATAGDPTKLLVGYVGSSAITINTPFTGTLLSPNAAVTLPTGSSPHNGAFFAKSLSAQPDVVVTTRSFQSPCQGVVIDDGNACTIDACDPNTGVVSHVPAVNGSACSDGNACTTVDACQAGVCVGASPVVCTALDQCHSAGVCAAATGQCSNPSKADGSSCSDGNACTQSDSCQAGACTGANAITCTAQDQCHSVGTCNTTTGACSNPAKADGAACGDGNACTQSDTCQAGACVGGSPVLCVALDQCHAAGTCNPSTGACSNSLLPDGTLCSDANACTQVDTCQAGTCTGASPIACNAPDQCHLAGACDPATGACSNPTKSDGSACSDGNACSQADSCQAGACVGASPVVCTASDQCHVAGTCDSTTGACSNPSKANGSTCSDGNGCTQSDVCQSGSCVGSNPVVCAALDQCHLAGSCDAASGTCSNPVKSDGSACNDANNCTTGEACTAGLCQAGTTVATDDGNPCTADTCDPSGGVSHTPVSPGTACDDSDLCNGHETCTAIGFCSAGSPLLVDDGNPCTTDACTPASGVTHTPVPAGSSCADSNACNGVEQCNASGACTPSTPQSVDDGNPCTADSCDPVEGVKHVALANGASCADSNLCNGSETCQAGTCLAGTAPAVDDGNSCTSDSCDPVFGIQHLPSSPGSTCSAANSCGGPGQCDASGSCIQPAADDGNPCTIDQCDPASGTVIHPPTPAGGSCAAVDACHFAGACDSSGRCNPGPPITHDDGDPCTIETCDPSNGFVQRTCAPLDPTVATILADSNAWIYSGANPVQTGVAVGTIDRVRAALLKGLVLTRDGFPLSGATVSIVAHPEFGTTVTQTNGEFEMVVNGGSSLAIRVQRLGFLSGDRTVDIGWSTYLQVPDITLVQADPQVTSVSLTGGGSDFRVIKGLAVSDKDGLRQPTVLVPPGTAATMVKADGTTVPLDQLHVRVTEFTVGPDGPKMMPASLPASSAYTHAFEINADEAVAVNANSVQFSQPLIYYLNNFLNFPAGTIVPLGSYDRTLGAWVAEKSGKVIQIVAVVNGIAQININADPAAETPAQLLAVGISAAEQAQLGQLYTAGQSLWRVQLPHFTAPYDCNWAQRTPNASPPPPSDNRDDNDNISKDKCEQSGGSSVECQNQTLREELPIAGTPFKLSYSSESAPGRKGKFATIIPLSGATVPTTPIPLLRIELDVEVAGRHFQKTFPPAVNQSYSFSWDGLDNFGRQVQGVQTAVITVSYLYPTLYADGTPIFAGYPPGTGQLGPTRTDIAITRSWTKRLGQWDQRRASGFGGWSLSAHHDYDVDSRILALGSGDIVRADALPESQRQLAVLTSVYPTIAVAPDGTVFLTNTSQVFKVVNGVPIVIAGSATAPRATTGDGGPASAANFTQAEALAMDPKGNLLIADYNVIRRIEPNGTITRFAGNGTFGFSGDGGPATAAALNGPQSIVAHEGKVYVADTNRIRVIDPNGTIRTIAGTGNPTDTLVDGSPAAQTDISPASLAFDGSGNLYFGNLYSDQILQIRRDGSIYHVAGCANNCNSLVNGASAKLSAIAPWPLTAAPDGTLFGMSDSLPEYLVKITPEGILQTLTKKDEPGFVGLYFGPDTLYANMSKNANAGTPYTISKLNPAMPGIDIVNSVIPSADGRQVYLFDPRGKHLETRDAVTGVHLLQFGYDANGLLQSISDQFGNVTGIERASDGVPSAIVAPYGQRTALSLDSNGLLTAVTDPANNATTMEYTPDGLLTRFTDVRGFSSLMSYDSLGRITTDADGAGATKAISRTELSDGWRTAVQNSDAASSAYEIHTLSTGAQLRLVTHPDGTSSSSTIDVNGTATTTMPDGTTIVRTPQPDPRFGLAAPIVSEQIKLPSGLTQVIQRIRTVTLANPNELLSLLTLQDRTNLNSYSSTQSFTSATRTWNSTSAARRISNTILDGQNNPTQWTIGDNNRFLPRNFEYDSQGRLTLVAQDTRQQRNTYFDTADATNGYLASTINALSQTTSYNRDPIGRILTELAADLTQTTYGWDAAGNLTQVGPPGRPAHVLNYTPVSLLDTYTPPVLASAANPRTVYEYNLARQPTKVTRPDGTVLDYHYDNVGRLLDITAPSGTLTNVYFGTTPCTGCSPGKLSQILGPDGVNLAFSFDGILPTREAWSGLVAGSVTKSYNAEFRATGETVVAGASTSSIAFNYDGDGVTTSAGSMSITAGTGDGQVENARLGSVQDFYSYNPFGELAKQTSLVLGSQTFIETYHTAAAPRDALGRITQKRDMLQGDETVIDYAYDNRGRLKTVTTNGAATVTYGYDANGNRLTATTAAGVTTATYDDQDRLLSYGPLAYTYTANGELETKTNTANGDITAYQYDVFGNLKRVDLPSGVIIEYLVDGKNRRIAKKKNGMIVKQWLYRDQLHPVAELAGDGTLISTFVYGTGKNVPDYLIQGAASFRIWSDQLGSPRLIVNAATGALIQRMRHDEFGNVLEDTSPGFTPFGFAGGLYDADTGLVRFGARDYDPVVGRWISKDPTRFRGGVNLYTYAWNDPVNFVDRTGRQPTGPKGAGGASGTGEGGSEGDGGIPWTPAQPWPRDPTDWCGSGANGKYVPETDALGSSNLQNACYAHDNCYSNCGSDKFDCDWNLGHDMARDCAAQGDTCDVAGMVYFGFVSGLGQSAYNNAQANCVCGGP